MAERRVPESDVRTHVTAALAAPESLPSLPPRELDLTLRLLRRVRLLGRVAVAIERAGLMGALPRVAADQLESAVVAADARARAARWELDRLARALQDLPEVPVVALKGCGYLLADTPNAPGRSFSDVDLMMPERDLAAVEACLERHGWRAKELTPYDDHYYREWAHELPPLRHAERDIEVDLHHNLLMRTARLKPSPARLLEAARPVPGSRFKVLAPVDMVLHAIVHLFYGGDMVDALRELVDIDQLIRHYGTHEAGFWEAFWARAEALDLARPAFYGVRYAQRLLGTPVPLPALYASRAGAPVAPMCRLMDWLVLEALFPQHPDAPRRRATLARWCLYLRSHWVKMPPWMLAKHLGGKLCRGRIEGRAS